MRQKTSILMKGFPIDRKGLEANVNRVNVIRERYPIIFDKSLETLASYPEGRGKPTRERLLDLRPEALARKAAIVENLAILNQVALGLLGTHAKPEEMLCVCYFIVDGKPAFLKEFLHEGFKVPTELLVAGMDEVEIVGCPRCRSQVPLIMMQYRDTASKNVAICFGCDIAAEVGVN